MSHYDEEPMSVNGYLSTSGFPEANLEEPSDDGVIYCKNWAEVEEKNARVKVWLAKWKAEQAAKELVESK